MSSSPVRIPNSYASPCKPLRVDIPKELNSVERRAFDLTKQFSQNISESASRPYFPRETDDSSPWDHHKLLVKRGETYAQYLSEQNNRKKKDKEEAVNAVNQRVKRGLSELDEIREQENKGLVRRLLDFNNEFGKKVKDLERSVAKQIERMKQELMESIRNEERECENRIKERSLKLIEESIPASKREEGYARPSSASPTKYLGPNSPDRKTQAMDVMRKLEESREKIREIRASEYGSTPGKESGKNVKRYGSGLSEKKDEMYRSRGLDSQNFQKLEESREKVREIRASEYASTPGKESGGSVKKYSSGLSENKDEIFRSRYSDSQDLQDEWM